MREKRTGLLHVLSEALESHIKILQLWSVSGYPIDELIELFKQGKVREVLTRRPLLLRGDGWWICTGCGCDLAFSGDDTGRPNYCPDCGAEIEWEELCG